MKLIKITKIIKNILIFLMDSIRPLLGPRGTCIYPITCRQYTRNTLKQRSLFIALPLIVLRVLSCNPITALFLNVKFYFDQKRF